MQRGRPTVYTFFDELEIGGTPHVIPPSWPPTAGSVAMLCQRHGKRLGRKFAYKVRPDFSIEVRRVAPTQSHDKHGAADTIARAQQLQKEWVGMSMQDAMTLARAQLGITVTPRK